MRSSHLCTVCDILVTMASKQYIVVTSQDYRSLVLLLVSLLPNFICIHSGYCPPPVYSFFYLFCVLLISIAASPQLESQVPPIDLELLFLE